MTRNQQPQAGQMMERTFKIDFRDIEDNPNQIEISFSSEYPVDRWFGPEILSHDEGAVDLTRLQNVGVVLFSHGRDANYGKMPIGKIDKSWIDTGEKRGKALITFDDDEDSQRVKAKVKSGSIKGVSFGYLVNSYEEVMPGKTSANGRFTGPAYIGLSWEPYEISIEPIPADPTVGVGRSVDEPVPAGSRTDNTKTEEENENMQREIKTPYCSPETGNGGSDEGQERSQVDILKEREAAMKAERQRAGDITTMCREFDVDPAEYINDGSSVDHVRAAILEKLKRERKPLSSGANIRVEREEADKIREAASDAILLRGNKKLEKIADGARDLRSLSLRDLAVDCLIRTGRQNAHRLDNDDLFREAFATPDSQFASILNSSVNKTMSIAYRAAATTYQQWCGIGSNSDFKAATHYQISEGGDLLPMTQNGEFKFDEMSDSGVSKALATFGRSFGMTRQALINDDIGVLTKVPETYVRAAKRGINRLVYKTLCSNPSIFDGLTLFHANHGNIGTPGSIGKTTVGEARKNMRKQKNLRGKETLNIGPTYLIVPAEKETEAQTFLASPTDIEQNNSGVANIFKGSLQLVVDAEIDSLNPSAYYFAADPGDIDTIEVTYLNGDDMPKLESQIGFDFLGIKWRIFIDYGVTILDYKGLSKNDGV